MCDCCRIEAELDHQEALLDHLADELVVQFVAEGRDAQMSDAQLDAWVADKIG